MRDGEGFEGCVYAVLSWWHRTWVDPSAGLLYAVLRAS